MEQTNNLQTSTPRDNSLEDFDRLLDEVLGLFLNHDDGKSPSYSEIFDEPEKFEEQKHNLQLSTPKDSSLEDFDGLKAKDLGTFLYHDSIKGPSHSEIVNETLQSKELEGS